ncbi:glycosyl hydrolase family 2 [Labedella gwakjiensis]|uniref:Glycoside hydrolase family 2 n=1 Tax=Labedella gwakjiensis TaxID=390269 RepID=A0A2P8GU67_9MICO|nr:sugar-binding domain-containing protein [Labedella gwakjiensis]PSL37508.1 glycosyl hydrolase family 2 [Labedella gwakjiensis]RUQ84811.1 glycoside hydrolase family 2 [Labedella gwakjiensis]
MTTPPPPASRQDGTHPRPQLLRSSWQSLDGDWDFAFGDDPAAFPDSVEFDRTIVVPYPPESPASGIDDKGFHLVAWYRRRFDQSDLSAAGYSGSGRALLHFAAVDRTADVWVNGAHVGRHVGGQTPFSFDVTDVLTSEGDNVVVVRAVDDPHDVAVPRGKQDWREDPHVIWYHRTTGIWQPVWLEGVPADRVEALSWEYDLPSGRVDLDLALARRPVGDLWATVSLALDDLHLADMRVRLLDTTTSISLHLARQRNGQQHEELLWSPEHPRLIDATVTVDGGTEPLDAVSSYLGLRSVGTASRRFLLNDRPVFLRSVLAQNYWPESHLAAPDAAALRREVELIIELGFNAARVHQKAEDPRFLHWADRLGLMIWGETAGAYEFSPRAVAALVSEWTEIVERDRSHPSIVAWVPLNESWGVQHIAHDPRQQAFSRGIVELTRSLDTTRPVISNDGWEHTDSDIWTVHDYEADPVVLASRYGSIEAFHAMLADMGPAGRRISVGQEDRGEPVMLTEFGGVSYIDEEVDGAWGYSSATDAVDFAERVSGIVGAVSASPLLSGFCYTQLTDTGQETNGLLRADRSPKAPIEQIRRIVTGDAATT